MKQAHRISGRPSVFKEADSGSILIFLIVLMVIFTVLGVGMVSMFGTSVLSTFASNNARRAGYLAESGLRYTVSEVRNAAAAGSTPEAALTAIDDGINVKWFNVFPGASRYRVSVYPYWSNTAAGTGVASSIISTTVPNSGFPPGFAIPTAPGGASVARLHVGPNDLVSISNAVGATPGSTAVTYTLASDVKIPTGITGYANLAFPTINSVQTITRGYPVPATPLVLNINAVSAIPEKNGMFMDAVSGRLYDYQTATLAGSNVQLENINWTGGAATSTFPADSYLIFSQSARLDSTGDHLQTQRVQTDYLSLYSSTSSMGGPPQNYQPEALTDAGSGFSDLSALDVSQSSSQVIIQGYIATGGTHSYWAAFRHLGEVGYRFIDPEEAGCYIGYHVAPISDAISGNLRNSWMQYHNLSYDVQVKMGWDLNLPFAAQGVAVRWHESPDFHDATSYRYYQGYGITFMRYDDNNRCTNDMIPNTIKPSHSMRENLLLVLWEQKVNASGVPTKDWLAYAELGDPSFYHSPATERNQPDPDQKVTGNQGWPDGRLNDNATIVVRVEDKFTTTGGVTTRVNDIKVFYGDASSQLNFEHDSRAKDGIAINKQRARYYPKWLEAGESGTLTPINPQWPSNLFGLNGDTITYWHDNPAAYDYFSLTNTAPMAPYNSDGDAVELIKNSSPKPGFSSVNLLADKCTIRTTDFALDSFPSGRKEIGLIGIGNLNSSNRTVAFDDFYIQILGGY